MDNIEFQSNEWLQRTRILYGEERVSRFSQSSVLIVGLGGVGAYAAEMLCRCGVGHLFLVDADTVHLSNINRQLPALHSTVGQSKVAVLKQRFEDINPNIHITALQEFLDENAIRQLLTTQQFNFVIDAIDSVRPKCTLIETCLDHHISLVSSMGAGAKTDIQRIQLADLWKTHECTLSRVVRSYLRREGYKGRRVPTVFSDEPVHREAVILVDDERNKKSTAGTAAFVTATFGNYLAWYVIEHL